MKKTIFALAASAAVMLSGQAFAKTKACFIYIGPTGDFGWTYQHDQGRKSIEAGAGRSGRNGLSGKRSRKR